MIDLALGPLMLAFALAAAIVLMRMDRDDDS